MDHHRALSPDQQILLILGRANQVKYATIFENIERCGTLSIEMEDVEGLINSLLEYAEQVSKPYLRTCDNRMNKQNKSGIILVLAVI